MEFNCPECGTPHAFPEDQIPATGIVVACTACATHITLDQRGVVGPEPDKTAALSAAPPMPPAPAPRNEPPAPSAPPPPFPMDEIPEPPREPIFGDAALSSKATASDSASGRDSGILDVAARAVSSAAGAAAAAAKEAATAAERAFDSAAAEEMEGEIDVPEGLSFPGFRPSAGIWSWRDLPRAFVGLFDKNRVMFATGGFWAALVAFGLLQWVGGFLGAKVFGALGTIFNIVAWLGLAAVAAFVVSVLGFVCHQTIIEQRSSSIKAGIAWAKEWIKSVVGTPIAFILVVAAIAVAEGVVGALGRIPFAGPIVWGAASGAVVLASLAAGAVLVAMVYSLPLYVPIIYNEKTGPKETLKRLYGMFRTHGFGLMGYVLTSILMIGFAFFVTVLPARIAAEYLTLRVGAASMGPNFFGTLANIPAALQSTTAAMAGGLAGETGFGHTIGGILAGLGMTVGTAFVIGIVALTYVTAGCIIYSIVTGRKKA